MLIIIYRPSELDVKPVAIFMRDREIPCFNPAAVIVIARNNGGYDSARFKRKEKELLRFNLLPFFRIILAEDAYSLAIYRKGNIERWLKSAMIFVISLWRDVIDGAFPPTIGPAQEIFFFDCALSK